MSRPTAAVIDLKALRHNYLLAQALAPESNTLAVIKANAYGHGAIAVARALEDLVPAFAVACLDEALDLRATGITKPILLLDGFFSVEELQGAAVQSCWLLVGNRWQIEALQNANLPTPATVWLKVDSGMRRLGVSLDEVADCYRALSTCANVRPPVVIATHLACADELDKPHAGEQIQRFKSAVIGLSAPLSIANSPGLLGWPNSRADWNRPGYMLYGNSPFTCPQSEADQLVPVMSVQSRVMALRTVAQGETVGYGGTWRAERTSRIATVPIGYGDGYPRNAPSGTPIIVNGQRAALAGRVSMDLITVDVTDVTGVVLDSEVELWGKQLSVEEVAACAGTIGYELLTRIPARLVRRYSDC
jgi:alanine racemase